MKKGNKTVGVGERKGEKKLRYDWLKRMIRREKRREEDEDEDEKRRKTEKEMKQKEKMK